MKNEKDVVRTVKKFWEVIDKSNFASKECYGYDGFLNSLSILLGESAEFYELEGNEAMARIRRKQADRIYEELKELGLYD